MKIFISYSSKDREAADFIAEQLRVRGADIFIDYQRLVGGEDFIEQLAAEIESCDSIIFVLSEHSAESRWVRKEIQYADHYEKRIVPVALDNATIPRALFFLTTIQRIELAGWENDRQNSKGLRQLAATLGLPEVPPTPANKPIRTGVISAHTAKDLKVRFTLLGHQAAVRSIAAAHDGTFLASAGSGLKSDSRRGAIKLWRLTDGALTAMLEGHEDEVNAIVLSADDRLLISGSRDSTLRVWDLINLREIAAYKTYHEIRALAISPDDKLVAFSPGDETLHFWNIALRSQVKAFKAHKHFINAIAFSAQGAFLASGSSDNTVKMWDANTFDEICKLVGHTNSVLSLAVSPDEALIASGSDDRTVRLWLPSTYELKMTLVGHTSSVQSVAFSPDGMLLVSSGLDGMRFWECSRWKQRFPD